MPSHKLIYWEGPGRGEGPRLALTIGGIPFENEVLTGQRWEALKPSTPWGQVPVLEVDGQLIAQTPAIMNYVGRLTKLLPADAVQGAKVEEFCATIEDCANAAVAPSFGKSGQAKLDSRKQACAPGSKLHEWLAKVDVHMANSRSGFAVGDSLTIADIRAFCEFSAMVSGWYDGFPATLLNKYHNIQVHRAKIASLPKVKAYYASHSDQWRQAFQPFDPTAAKNLPIAPVTSLVAEINLLTTDPIPEAMKVLKPNPATTLTLHKSTYPANAPSEDRSTLVIGDGFIFTGVWDGHGGVQASDYSEYKIYDFFKQHFDMHGGQVAESFQYAYRQTDETYLADAKARNDAGALFAGTCAVGCFVDCSSNTVCCSNLGDSRAVIGKFEDGELKTIPLSEDHSAHQPGESERIKSEHPNDPTALVHMSEDDDDWRVKGICAFTRSIGDTQMKDKAAATIYNSYTRGWKVMPRPGVKAKGEVQRTLPYISVKPEYMQMQVSDGFLVVACDGVWDEMSSDEAVKIIAKLLLANKGNPEANIADLFIEETLKKAVVRLQETIEEEEDLTLEELKSRPQGKADYSARSSLHDDITCVIIQFDSDASMVSSVASKINLSASDPKEMAHELFQKIDVNGDGLLDRSEIAALSLRLGKTLTPSELDSAMREMDADNSGEVDVTEFENWWASVGIKMMRRSKTQRMRQASDTKTPGTIGAVLSEIVSTSDDPERNKTTQQMLRLSKTMEGMSTYQLKMLFDALDVDKNGTLDRDEIAKLVATVLEEDAIVEKGVMDSCFEEMDEDNSGTVEWNEFAAFFDLAQTSV